LPALGIVCFLVIEPTRWFCSPETFPATVAGITFAYVAYECLHFFMHFGKTSSHFLNGYKKQHTEHHYYRGFLGFGVTHGFWDCVFNTELKV